jgi:hypothetical protein
MSLLYKTSTHYSYHSPLSLRHVTTSLEVKLCFDFDQICIRKKLNMAIFPLLDSYLFVYWIHPSNSTSMVLKKITTQSYEEFFFMRRTKARQASNLASPSLDIIGSDRLNKSQKKGPREESPGPICWAATLE